MQQPGNTDTATSIMNKVHFVEMSVSASGGQDQIQDELKAFADQLKPYVP